MTPRSSSLYKRALIKWHEIVVGDSNQCHYCKMFFYEIGFLVGDHVLTKGSRPDLILNIKNGVPCCKTCNDSNNKYVFMNKHGK